MSLVTSILLWDLWCLWSSLSVFSDRSETREIFPRTEQLDPIVPERANHPISDQCPMRWFQILLNCEKLMFVSYTSNLLEQTYDFQKRTMFLQKWILNLQDLPQKSESWNSPSLHCLAVFATWQYCLYSQVWWIYEINRFRGLSQALVHFVLDRSSLFTDHRISSRPKRAKFQHFRDLLRAYMWQFSNRFRFCFFEVVVIDAWSRCFVELLSRPVCQLTISFHTLLCMTIHVIRPWRNTKILRWW